MKKTFLIVLYCIFMGFGFTLSVYALHVPYKDIQSWDDNDWYKKIVARMSQAGIIDHFTGPNLSPNEAMQLVDNALLSQKEYLRYDDWTIYTDKKYKFSVLHPRAWETISYYPQEENYNRIFFWSDLGPAFYEILVIPSQLSLEDYIKSYTKDFLVSLNYQVKSININGEDAMQLILFTNTRVSAPQYPFAYSKKHEIFLKKNNIIFLIRSEMGLSDDFENFYTSFQFLDSDSFTNYNAWSTYKNEKYGISISYPSHWLTGNIDEYEKGIINHLPQDRLLSTHILFAANRTIQDGGESTFSLEAMEQPLESFFQSDEYLKHYNSEAPQEAFSIGGKKVYRIFGKYNTVYYFFEKPGTNISFVLTGYALSKEEAELQDGNRTYLSDAVMAGIKFLP